MTRQFLSFVVAGGLAAGVNWGSNLGLKLFMPLEISVVLAYALGMTTAFILTRVFVFAPSGRSPTDEYLRFVLVNAVALVQVWIVTIVLARFILPWVNWTFMPEATSHFVGVASPIVTSYFGHRYFTFSRARNAVDDQRSAP